MSNFGPDGYRIGLSISDFLNTKDTKVLPKEHKD